MSAFQITDRTELANVSIVTIEQAVSRRTWTYIGTPEGSDVLVQPDGSHWDESRIMQAVNNAPNGAIAALVDFIARNV